MSDELQAKVQAAVDQHLAENGGGFVTAWHFVADYIDEEGDRSWLSITAEDQQQMTTMGLIAWAQGVAEHQQRTYLEEP